MEDSFRILMQHLFKVSYSQLFVNYCTDACLTPATDVCLPILRKLQEYVEEYPDESLCRKVEIALKRLVATEAYL